MTDPEYDALLQQAQAGDAGAQFSLGWYFDMERHDYAAARKWYEQAAVQGDPTAWNNLACMVLNGEGCVADPVLATRYYRKAAECGDESGIYNYACILHDLAATAEDWREVIRLYRRSGHPSGYYNLGILYDTGNEFIAVDHGKANRCYRLAADRGHVDAATNLAVNLHDGIGCRKDWKESFRYIKFAAEHGDELSFHMLGEDYALGHGTRRNYAKAFLWFKRSWFATGGATAAGWLGDCYMRGRGVKRDSRKAFLWMKRAAKLKDERSNFDLGFHLISGNGSWPKDVERGRSYLKQYLELQPDDGDAAYWLGKSYGKCYQLAMPCFEQLWRRDRDPWSAYELVKQKIAYRQYWAPEEFSEMEGMLRFAVRRNVPGAGRLLRSRRWRRLRVQVATSEELAAKYRRSLRWGDGRWDYVLEFHKRGGRAEFEICRAYLQSKHRLDVIAGADLLAQLGCFESVLPFAEESTILLIPRMREAATDDERLSVLRAVAWQHTAGSRKFLLRYAGDQSAALRHIVAWGLRGENREEAAALLKLAHDSEVDVWDWAVFNLIGEDGESYPELLTGLTELAGRPEALMRYQAIAALASRHAPNAESLLRQELQKPLSDGYELNYLEDAATYLNLPELIDVIAEKEQA